MLSRLSPRPQIDAFSVLEPVFTCRRVILSPGHRQQTKASPAEPAHTIPLMKAKNSSTMSRTIILVVGAAIAVELLHEGGRPHTEVVDPPQQVKAPQVSAITTSTGFPPGKFITAGMNQLLSGPAFDGSAWVQTPVALRTTASSI